MAPTDLNHPIDSVTHIAYNGLSVTTTDPKGNTSTKVVNAPGKRVTTTDAEGNPIRYTCDPVGDLWGCAPHPKT